jgi:hypothetical protein
MNSGRLPHHREPRPDLSVHCPRSRCREAHLDPRRRDVSRQDRGGCRQAYTLRPPTTSLYPGSSRVCAHHASVTAQAEGGRPAPSRRRYSHRSRPTHGLPLPYPLPARDVGLPHAGTAKPCFRTGPCGGLPFALGITQAGSFAIDLEGAITMKQPHTQQSIEHIETQPNTSYHKKPSTPDEHDAPCIGSMREHQESGSPGDVTTSAHRSIVGKRFGRNAHDHRSSNLST